MKASTAQIIYLEDFVEPQLPRKALDLVPTDPIMNSVWLIFYYSFDKPEPPWFVKAVALTENAAISYIQDQLGDPRVGWTYKEFKVLSD